MPASAHQEGKTTMRTIRIDEQDFETAADCMAYLASELDFPAHFGGTLPALGDCLGDIAEPTRLKLRRRRPGARTWFERMADAMMRAACENESLSVRVKVH